ncbi:MAG: acyl-CoA dehydrogenase family protein, partial [Deltaproteobacteria bacterium]|nr:acyl-CoA dehydrogenase family protein [Deltaproteobacteria bacterium]
MDFSFKEETILLKNNAARYLKEKCPSSFIKNILKDEKGFSPIIWKEMAEMGWLGLIYDEQYGGIGGSFFDLFILLEEMGKVLLPSPFFCSAVLSGLVIREAGDANLKAEYLPATIRGEKILTMGLLDERGRYDYEQPNLEAKESSDGSYAIKGTRILVPYANVAHEILVCANVKGVKAEGPTLLKIHGQADGQKKIPLDMLTGEKTFAVVYENV